MLNSTYYNILTGNQFPTPLNNRVFDYSYSIQNKLGNLYEPVIDQLWIEKKRIKPTWPNNKPYAVCLTHDVDVISLHAFQSNLRRLKHISKTHRQQRLKQNLILSYESIDNIRKGLFNQTDPYHQFDYWLEIEKKIDARSTFFFSPEKVLTPHFTDCWYKYNDKIVFEGELISVGELMKEIHRRGWEIGLHPSWNSSNSISELKYQKEQIEKVINSEIQSVRQHFLHFDQKITPLVQSAAGFKYDSTIGFNDNIGFKSGTSYAYSQIDLKSKKKLPIIEIPLTIQDGAMFHPKKGMRLDKITANEYVQLIKEKVSEVGGIITILWHPNSVDCQLKETYEEILLLLKKDDPWFATVKQVGEWWEKNINIDLLSFVKDIEG